MGQAFFDGVVSGHPDMAVPVRQGGAEDLEAWLAEGMVDVILTYGGSVRSDQTVHPLPPEELVLYATVPDTPTDADPDYIFMDHGDVYRHCHDAAYHHAGVARISFDSSWWALQCLLERGASACLPRALAEPYVTKGYLHPLSTAPVFSRKKHLVTRDSATTNWDWFTPS